jgi:hypothetical protein
LTISLDCVGCRAAAAVANRLNAVWHGRKTSKHSLLSQMARFSNQQFKRLALYLTFTTVPTACRFCFSRFTDVRRHCRFPVQQRRTNIRNQRIKQRNSLIVIQGPHQKLNVLLVRKFFPMSVTLYFRLGQPVAQNTTAFDPTHSEITWSGTENRASANEFRLSPTLFNLLLVAIEGTANALMTSHLGRQNVSKRNRSSGV